MTTQCHHTLGTGGGGGGGGTLYIDCMHTSYAVVQCVCVCVCVCVWVSSLVDVPQFAAVVHAARHQELATPVPATTPHWRRRQKPLHIEQQ